MSNKISIVKYKFDPSYHNSKRGFYNILRDLDQNTKFDVWVIPEKAKRSIPQNAFYWGVVLKIISIETGDDCESIHEYFKEIVFKSFFDRLKATQGSKEINVSFDVRVYVVKQEVSTTKLTKALFDEYIELIRVWGLEFLGITIPHPTQIKEEQLEFCIKKEML